MNIVGLANRVVFTTKKYKPEIKFIFGVMTFAGALYTTHKAALKCEQIKKKRNSSLELADGVMDDVKEGNIAPEEYTEDDYKSDIRKINVTYTVDLVKNYSIPAALSIGSVLLFHGAMMDYRDLFVGVSAAYNALRIKFDDKMKFIKDQIGEEKFNELEEGFKTKQITKAQSTGSTDPKEKKEIRNKCNPYSRFFDDTHGCWTDNPEVNKNYLWSKQCYLNSRLQRNGYLFLNEAYEEMGYEPTDAGRVMGWLAKKPDGSINYIDFGIFNISDQASRWFVNGIEPVFLIDFNVDPQPITGRIGWAKF